MNWKPNSLNFNTTIMPTIIKEHATITYSDLTPILRAVSSHSFNISTIKNKAHKNHNPVSGCSILSGNALKFHLIQLTNIAHAKKGIISCTKRFLTVSHSVCGL